MYNKRQVLEKFSKQQNLQNNSVGTAVLFTTFFVIVPSLYYIYAPANLVLSTTGQVVVSLVAIFMAYVIISRVQLAREPTPTHLLKTSHEVGASGTRDESLLNSKSSSETQPTKYEARSRPAVEKSSQKTTITPPNSANKNAAINKDSGRNIHQQGAVTSPWSNAKELLDFSNSSSFNRLANSSEHGKSSFTPEKTNSSERGTGRYYSSPPSVGDASSYSSKHGLGTVKSPLSGSVRAAPNTPKSRDCLEYVGIDYLDDELIINLRKTLGVYLFDAVARFDVLVGMITETLVRSNKITSAQSDIMKALLRHTKESDESPLIGTNEVAQLTLSDVLNFCRRPEIRQLLVVRDKSSGIVSDLTSEYDALLCLFRISGDYFSAPTISTSSEQKSNVAESPLFSRGKHTRSSMSPSYHIGHTSDQGDSVVKKSKDILMDRESANRCTAYILYRAQTLAGDDHLRNYSWQQKQKSRGPLSHTVSDAEIVMSVFLHYCDSHFAPLVASEGNRFSHIHFFDATQGIPTVLPHGKSSVCIVRKSFEPTHFNILFQESDTHDLLELVVREGRQNCFEAILLFLCQLRKSDSSFGNKSGNTHVRRVMEDLFGSSDPASICSVAHHRQRRNY